MAKLLILFILLQTSLQANTASVDSLFKKFVGGLPPSERQKFSEIDRTTQKDAVIYEDKLTIRFFRKGILMAYDNKVKMFILKTPTPNQRSGTTFNRIYKKQQGRKTLGKPLEGPYMVFEDRFRFHIYAKGIIIFKAKAKNKLHQVLITEELFFTK